MESLVSLSAKACSASTPLPDGPLSDVVQSVKGEQKRLRDTVLSVVMACNGILHGQTCIDQFHHLDSGTINVVMPFEKKVPKLIRRLSANQLTVTMNNVSETHKIVTLNKVLTTIVGDVPACVVLDLQIGKVEELLHADMLCDCLTISKDKIQVCAGTTLDVIEDIMLKRVRIITHPIEDADISRVQSALEKRKDAGFTFEGVHTPCWSPKCAVCVKKCQVCESADASVYCTACDVYSSYQCLTCWDKQHWHGDSTRTQVHTANRHTLPLNIVNAVFLKE